MSRLVVISNRVPSPSEAEAGGLAVGLKAALRESGGLWFGWSGRSCEVSSREVAVTTSGSFSLATIDLSEAEVEGYYNGFANRSLWPLFHGRQDLSCFDNGCYRAYRRVNEIFAEHLLPLLSADDILWIHDYHLIPLGYELRRRGVENPVGFFLHIPFPSPDLLVALPWHAELAEALTAYDLVGFQTERDQQNFRDFVDRELQGRISQEGNAIIFGHRLRLGVFPIGIDTERFAAMAASTEVARRVERLTDCVAGRSVIAGVDRLDYTKGLVERFQAFETFLERFPDSHGRVSMIQVAAPSRLIVPEYASLRATLEQISGRVNGRYAEVDWVPLQYLNRVFSQIQLAALYRSSRIGLVTPLADGMNMVAKEYVAAQNAENPGVLVLSRFAGAVQELDGALVVNPHDIQAVANALRAALDMPLAERRARWRHMMLRLRRNDVAYWRRHFLRALEAAARPVYRPAVA